MKIIIYHVRVFILVAIITIRILLCLLGRDSCGEELGSFEEFGIM